ncbi:MAG TPA: glycosyltransferase [Gemmatimonadaceae bacterium]|nr:glycosyltransferase [Gemmatimonadaceae bacterium]
MRRNALIAQTLAASPQGAVVLLISGAKEMNAMALAPGIDCVTLPALTKDATGDYRPRNLDISRAELTTLRSRTIEAALDAFQPDLFIVDKLPRGAFGELDPALKSFARGHTRCVLGLRDILDDPGTVQREWAESGGEDAVASYYDAIWVYGDPTVYDLLSEYHMSHEVAEKVRFTGYLDPSARFAGEPEPAVVDALQSLPESSRLVLCQVGGGQDGAAVASAFAAADMPDETCGVVLTGPFMPQAVRDDIAARAAGNERLRMLEFSAEPAHLLRRADRVIGMGGYNTVCEILAMEKSALIVPRTRPRTEQLIRAERMRDLGALSMMIPDDMTPAALSDWMAREVPSPEGVRDRIDFNGLERIPHFADELLAVA